MTAIAMSLDSPVLDDCAMMMRKWIAAKRKKRSAMRVVMMTAIAESLDNTQVDGHLRILMSQVLQISAVRKKKIKLR